MAALGVHNSQEKEELLSQRLAIRSCRSHPRRMVCLASGDSPGVLTSDSVPEIQVDGEPKPIVLIDQDSNPHATTVEISFGDRLGALLDTIKAIKDLGLNVVKGVVTSEEGSKMRRKKFLVTRQDNNEKVDNPEILEAIRLTIINNLLQYHPESSEQLAMGEAFGQPPKTKLDVDVATHITVKRDGRRSLLEVETADRPGLLLEILKVVRDISIYVESAEIDTEGLVAKDKFYVTYHGEVLSPSMAEVLTNSLRYYLRRPDTEEDSY
jgi:UTP:GlnB (protein PII) uridylyltransferase